MKSDTQGDHESFLLGNVTFAIFKLVLQIAKTLKSGVADYLFFHISFINRRSIDMESSEDKP